MGPPLLLHELHASAAMCSSLWLADTLRVLELSPGLRLCCSSVQLASWCGLQESDLALTWQAHEHRVLDRITATRPLQPEESSSDDNLPWAARHGHCCFLSTARLQQHELQLDICQAHQAARLGSSLKRRLEGEGLSHVMSKSAATIGAMEPACRAEQFQV